MSRILSRKGPPHPFQHQPASSEPKPDSESRFTTNHLSTSSKMDDFLNPWALNSGGYDKALVDSLQYSYPFPAPPTPARSMGKCQIAAEVMPQNSTSQSGGETYINFLNASRDVQRFVFAPTDASLTSATPFEWLQPSISEQGHLHARPIYLPQNDVSYIGNVTYPQAQNPSWTGSNGNTPFGNAGFTSMAIYDPSGG